MTYVTKEVSSTEVHVVSDLTGVMVAVVMHNSNNDVTKIEPRLGLDTAWISDLFPSWYVDGRVLYKPAPKAGNITAYLRASAQRIADAVEQRQPR